MMMFWAWAGVPLGVYNITSSFNLALQIQPQILSFLSLLTWIQVYYYEKKWSVVRSLGVVVPVAVCMAGIEIGLIYALREGKDNGVEWPRTLMAVLAALFLACGVLAHYWDIYTHRTVRGISFTFCFLDALGDLTSLISVFFQPQLDVLGIVIYGVELTLWLGIFACGGYYNLRPWLLEKKSARRSSENGGENRVSVHDMPSSTSAFSTSSASVDAIGLRDRHTATISQA
jgi:type III secretory pathway component EscS